MLINKLTRPLSPERMDANRRNARKSTGPVSARGRAISSQNARKYDLLPFEKPTLPAQLTARYYGQFIPRDRKERRLVDILVLSERVRRYCLSVEKRARAAGTTDEEVMCLAKALVSTSGRLSAVPYYRDAAVHAHEDAFRRLEAMRGKAA